MNQNKFNKLNQSLSSILGLEYIEIILSEQDLADYNSNEYNPIPSPTRGLKIHSAKTKRYIGKIVKKNRANPNSSYNSTDYKEKHKHSVRIARENPNAKYYSKEWRNNLSEKRSKQFIVTNPSGQELKIKNLLQFSKDNNLSSANMTKVAQGLRSQHKGWLCRYA